MKYLNPRIERLKAMMNLEEKRAALQQQLDSLQQELATLQSNLFSEGPATATRSAKAAPAAKRGPRKKAARGALKEKIMAALEAAGSAGIQVRDLAAAMGTKPVNIHSWFHSTAKRIPGIRKITGGHYRLDGSPAKTAAQPRKSSKAKGKAPRAKSGGVKRGALASKILETLKSSGADGAAVKDIAAKLGAKYKNISIWFATTGKKNKDIKKVGPARYKLS